MYYFTLNQLHIYKNLLHLNSHIFIQIKTSQNFHNSYYERLYIFYCKLYIFYCKFLSVISNKDYYCYSLTIWTCSWLYMGTFSQIFRQLSNLSPLLWVDFYFATGRKPNQAQKVRIDTVGYYSNSASQVKSQSNTQSLKTRYREEKFSIQTF